MITPELLVEAGLYPDEASVLEDALGLLWQERPVLRMDFAIHQYQTQNISLFKAANLANVTFYQLTARLEQLGIQPHKADDAEGKE